MAGTEADDIPKDESDAPPLVTHRNHSLIDAKEDDGIKVKVEVEGEEEVVYMRKSRGSTSSLDDLVTSDSMRPFEGR